MKIIEPKVELWQQGNDSKAHVARCARVCYGRESGNDEATIKRLINDEHWSMFRHGTYYMIANDSDNNIQWEECSCLKGIRLEDVTEELEDKAYEEMRHN